MKSPIKSVSTARYLLPLITFGFLMAVWYGLKGFFNIHDFILPAPHDVLYAFSREWERLLPASITTFFGALFGFIASIVIGFLISILLYSSRWIHYSLYPYILFMQMIPIIATAAIVVILFDVGLQSVVIITFLIGFFPIVASGTQGLRSTPNSQVELFRLYKATPAQELIKLRIPYALPSYFIGIKIAATLAIIGAVTGEIFAGSSDRAGGLGFLIIIYKSELKTDAIYAATLICCVLGFIFVYAVHRIREKLVSFEF